eukprot:scaffold6711_cov118-Isochrysis_galbana.AAC.6
MRRRPQTVPVRPASAPESRGDCETNLAIARPTKPSEASVTCGSHRPRRSPHATRAGPRARVHGAPRSACTARVGRCVDAPACIA